jgi:hypothetical protein
MARNKSEITGSPHKIATRVTFDQWSMFRRLGGSVWLRNYLKNLIELQILRQSSQAIQDTVGGAVDVAVITLEKGFQWFKHKTLDDLWGNI